MSVVLRIMIIALCFSGYLMAEAPKPVMVHVPDSKAVAEVLAGTRSEASAAWWGFDESDSTEFLQAAIKSGARKLIVPNLGKPWIIEELFLESNQEIVFEEGVEIVAKKGSFRGDSDSLFRAVEKDNITIIGYGATLRMHKSDYVKPPYQKAEWRCGLMFYGCSNVKVYGLTIRDTGGDGILLATVGDASGTRAVNRDVHIKDVVCDNNLRQGISVISAENLLIEDCVFKNTSGTAPSAGIDIEPDRPANRLVNIVVRNCVAENNEGPGFCVYMLPLEGATSGDVSVLFENCHVRGGKGAGLVVGAIKPTGPGGLIEFRNCTVENIERQGAYIYDKHPDRAKVLFTDCVWKNVATGDPAISLGPDGKQILPVPSTPILIYLKRPTVTQAFGGVEFVNCTVYDDKNRPFIQAFERESKFGVSSISGSLTVHNPNGVRQHMGPNAKRIKLDVTKQ